MAGAFPNSLKRSISGFSLATYQPAASLLRPEFYGRFAQRSGSDREHHLENNKPMARLGAFSTFSSCVPQDSLGKLSRLRVTDKCNISTSYRARNRCLLLTEGSTVFWTSPSTDRSHRNALFLHFCVVFPYFLGWKSSPVIWPPCLLLEYANLIYLHQLVYSRARATCLDKKVLHFIDLAVIR